MRSIYFLVLDSFDFQGLSKPVCDVGTAVLVIDEIFEDGIFYKMVENDNIIVFSARSTFMKRNLQFSAIFAIIYDTVFT